MDFLVDFALLGLLTITAIAIVKLRNLFAVVMFSSIYSLLSASLFVVLDAVDVAFTEAAVGAGISTILMLSTLALVGFEEQKPTRSRFLPLLLVTITGTILVYGTVDMPPFGQPDNPAQLHVAPRYLQETPEAFGIPNVVTAVLASYRGYDTMGEVTVIFTAAIGVLLLLGQSIRRRRGDDE